MNAPKSALRSFILGGLLPVIAFTVIEEVGGTLWGIVAGMVFGLGEVFWEKKTQGRVDALTWAGNGLILVLGGISLVSNEGIWFKLQPALLEGAMALMLWGSVLLGRPFLVAMAQKQGMARPEILPWFKGLTSRLGVFMAVQAGVAVWAALHWSTAAWATLKGVGFTVSFVVYMVAETLVLRYRLASK